MRKQPYEWELECITDTDYELIIILHSSNHMLKLVFAGTKKQLEKRLKKRISEAAIKELDVIKEAPKYGNLILTCLMSKIRKLKKEEFGPDHINLINEKVEECLFIKNGGSWDIKVKITGLYKDDRR